MSIREATPEDVDAIRRVARDSWEADYPDILSRETVEAGVEEWYSEATVLDAVGSPHALVLVADEDGVVGFAHADWSGDVGHLLRLYVHPDHRRTGVGRRLVERTREALFDRDVDRVEAMVLADNDPGNAFYRDLGFEQVDQGTTTVGGESYPENRYALDRS